jgi:hypothetical protein
MLGSRSGFLCSRGAGLDLVSDSHEVDGGTAFIRLHQAAHGFQIQLRCEGYWPIALEYRVSADGSILESGTAGGIDYFALAPGTTAMLFVDLNFSPSAPSRQCWEAGRSR